MCCCGDFLWDDYSAMWHEILNNCRKNWIDSFEDGRTVVAIVESLGLLSELWVSHDKPSTMFKGACRKYLLIQEALTWKTSQELAAPIKTNNANLCC
jgi:hypothetical protein